MKKRNPFVRILEALDRFFLSRSRNAILLICLFMSLAIGATDFQASTGLLIAYLAPIALAAWYGGKREGAVIAVYCAIAWYVATAWQAGFKDLNPWTPWTFLARMMIFLVLTQAISRLREALRQQNELTQFIVHDLRSPISSAITGLQTLQQNGTHLDDLEQEMVSLALVSNQRALSLVNSMLDVAKLETGSMTIELTQVDLDGLVAACFEQVALWAAGSDIQLTRDAQVASGCLDADLTTRVLVNLISNALKFSPQGGEVKVIVSLIAHGGLRFAVQDFGKGIPPEFVQSIFEPFTQVAGTQGGTGLGLTFCRLAVQAQGGKIWAESVVGKGTTMIFTLPAHVPNA